MTESVSPFWKFSLGFYAEPGVAPACIALQEEAGVDVNVLLLLLFMAKSSQQAGADDVRAIDGHVAAWREETVKPLREVRRWLKAPPMGATADTEKLRTLVKRCELEAERLQQLALESTAAGMRFRAAKSPLAAARANVSAYGAVLGSLPKDAVDTLLDVFAKIS